MAHADIAQTRNGSATMLRCQLCAGPRKMPRLVPKYLTVYRHQLRIIASSENWRLGAFVPTSIVGRGLGKVPSHTCSSGFASRTRHGLLSFAEHSGSVFRTGRSVGIMRSSRCHPSIGHRRFTARFCALSADLAIIDTSA